MDAVLLTGGRATRLGGVDKPSLGVGGVPMVERALRAATEAGAPGRVVVVGPDPGLAGVAAVTREDPPGSGPVAAVAAALPLLSASDVALLATDLPFVTPAAVGALRLALAAAPPAAAAAMAVDGDGRDQPLLAVWRTPALRAAVASLGPPQGLPLKALTAAAPGPVLRVARLDADQAAPWFDCDTPDDLARARAVFERNAPMTPLDEWMDAVIAELGLAGAVDRDDARALMLDLARDVAHGVARPAAPVTAFLAGLAAGRAADPQTATPQISARIGELLGRWPGSSQDRATGG